MKFSFSEPHNGDMLYGNLGSYELNRIIGGGGNGQVWTVSVIDYKSETLQGDLEYVAKVFFPKTSYEYEKRERRFQKEIDFLTEYGSCYEGLMPIIDYADEGANNKHKWFLMPKARRYTIKRNKPLVTILEEFEELGSTIKKLHDNGYVHRDIKPQNILLLGDHVLLSDWGLVWHLGDEHITENGDSIGPYNIRPPEFDNVEDLNETICKKADVYLFAKTMWMAIAGNNSCFRGQYERGGYYCLKKHVKQYVETLEPLHQLLEKATYDEFDNRISIEDCISYINQQIAVCNNSLSTHIVAKFKYEEAVKISRNTIESDLIVLKESEKKYLVLKGLEKKAGIYYKEFGKEQCIGQLNLVNLQAPNTYSFVVDYGKAVLSQGDRFAVLEIGIQEIEIDKDNNCTIIADETMPIIIKRNNSREEIFQDELMPLKIGKNSTIMLKPF